jgi:ribosomal protein L13E
VCQSLDLLLEITNTHNTTIQMSSFANQVEITEEILTSQQFDAKKLKEAGHSAKQLKEAGFDAMELKAAGFTAVQLRVAGFSPADMRQGGYEIRDVLDAGFNHRRLMLGGFSAVEMRETLDLNLDQLAAAGFQVAHLRPLGFMAAELRAIGYTAHDLKPFFTPGEILRAGYAKDELKPLGLWPHDGTWHSYNNYWDCCFSLDKKSKFCEPTSYSSKMVPPTRGKFGF